MIIHVVTRNTTLLNLENNQIKNMKILRTWTMYTSYFTNLLKVDVTNAF